MAPLDGVPPMALTSPPEGATGAVATPGTGTAPAPSGAASGGERRVAAIDIGTNSIHLLIAAIDPALQVVIHRLH